MNGLVEILRQWLRPPLPRPGTCWLCTITGTAYRVEAIDGKGKMVTLRALTAEPDAGVADTLPLSMFRREFVPARPLAALGRLELRPGDTVVVSTPLACQEDLVALLRDEASGLFPDHRVLLLTQGATISAIGSAGSATIGPDLGGARAGVVGVIGPETDRARRALRDRIATP
jgi:hypothetical protein